MAISQRNLSETPGVITAHRRTLQIPVDFEIGFSMILKGSFLKHSPRLLYPVYLLSRFFLLEGLLFAMRIGHARVSTKKQKLDLQLIALKKAGCTKIFKEKISGKSKRLPELEKAVAALKRGDTLVFWHLDRLGRNARALINLEYELKLRGVSLVSLTQNFDTSTPRGELEFLEACVKAQGESVRISERTIAGMQAARLKGHYPGACKRLNERQINTARRLAKNNDFPVRKIAQRLKCSPSTAWRALQPEYAGEVKHSV